METLIKNITYNYCACKNNKTKGVLLYVCVVRLKEVLQIVKCEVLSINRIITKYCLDARVTLRKTVKAMFQSGPNCLLVKIDKDYNTVLKVSCV